MKVTAYKVEKLVSGGLGLVRDQEGAVFVPFVLPGEIVRLGAIVKRGPRRVAEALEIVEASPDRVAPPCPLFGRCGGCRLQHAEYGAQLRSKREMVEEALARIAGVEAEVAPVLAAASPYHYRSRIRLQVRGGRAGFFAERTHELLHVEHCWIAREELNAALDLLSGIVKTRGIDTVELMLMDDGSITAVTSGRSRKTYCLMNGRWNEAPARRVSFTQVNRKMNESLRALVAELAKQGPCAVALDLYAGAGNLTLPLLQVCGRVTAVDSDPAAAEMGRRSVAAKDTDRVRFVNLAAEDFLAGARDSGRPDLIVLDPPRAGARPAVPGIVRLAPPRVIYVSCDPATLARDLKDLAAAGYTLRSITPLDMFPQTAHVETVSLAEKVK